VVPNASWQVIWWPGKEVARRGKSDVVLLRGPSCTWCRIRPLKEKKNNKR